MVIYRIRQMVSFELGKEILKDVFRLVTSVGQRKKIEVRFFMGLKIFFSFSHACDKTKKKNSDISYKVNNLLLFLSLEENPSDNTQPQVSKAVAFDIVLGQNDSDKVSTALMPNRPPRRLQVGSSMWQLYFAVYALLDKYFLS